MGLPAKLWENEQLVLQADRMTFDQVREVLTLSSAYQGTVRLGLGDQGNLTARQITFQQRTRRAELLGPGSAEVILANGSPATISYDKQLSIGFATEDTDTDVTDATGLGQMRPEWLEFDGGLYAVDPNGFLAAQAGRITFFTNTAPINPITTTADNQSVTTADDQGATTVDNRGTPTAVQPADQAAPPQIESLHLTGDVRIDRDEGTFETQQLDMSFQLDPHNRSQPKELVAQQDVQIESPQYICQIDKELKLLFTAKADAGTRAVADGRAEVLGLGLASSDYNVAATAHGSPDGVRLTASQQGYQIIGSELTGDSAQNRWTIQGKPARVVGLTDQAPIKELTGSIIIADMGAGVVEIPKAGSTTLLTSTDLTGAQLAEPEELHISWLDGAAYRENHIELHSVTASIENRDEQSTRRTTMSSAAVTIDLSDDATDGRSKKPDADTETTVETMPAQLNSLVAHGPNVRVISEERANATGEILTAVQLQAQRVHFDNDANSLAANGPGWIEVVDYQEAAGDPNRNEKAKPDLKTRLTESMDNAGPSYTLVQFRNSMTFDFNLGELQFRDRVALDHLPLAGVVQGSTTDITGSDGLRRLDCDRLTITLADEPTAPTSDPTYRAQSDQATQKAALNIRRSLRRMTAEGSVFFEIRSGDRGHFVVADAADYQAPKQDVIFSGTVEQPVRFDHMQFLRVKYNMDTDSIDAQPFGLGSLPARF